MKHLSIRGKSAIFHRFSLMAVLRHRHGVILQIFPVSVPLAGLLPFLAHGRVAACRSSGMGCLSLPASCNTLETVKNQTGKIYPDIIARVCYNKLHFGTNFGTFPKIGFGFQSVVKMKQFGHF
jgi:hypothetical protein